MLHLVLAVADQSKNRLDTVIFSRFGELSDEFLGDLLAAIRRVNPDYFNPTLWRRVIRTQIHRRQQADDAIVDLGDERGAVGAAWARRFQFSCPDTRDALFRSGAPPS
jgi:transposase